MTHDSKNKKARVISIVSGKGGCGKTLLTAVIGRALAREGLKVLLIDFDIFVRGLTILLADYLEKGLQTKTKITVSDLLLSSESQNIGNLLPEKLAIFRFFKCDVLPACSNIAAPLDYDQKQLSSFKFCKSIVNKLLSNVKNKYDIILIDNRASIDSLVLATCHCSDVIISVAEDDDLCLQTNSNIVNHLRYKQSIKNVYTIINKGRRITSYDGLKNMSWHRPEFNYVGVIPFDIEIMEDFGKSRFWLTFHETLYFRAIIDVWNNMAKMEGLKRISLKKYRFPPSIFMSKKEGKFTMIERMMRLYSIMLVFAGIFMAVYDKVLRGNLNLFEILSLTCIVSGLVVLILSTTSFRRWLLGKSDEPKKKD